MIMVATAFAARVDRTSAPTAKQIAPKEVEVQSGTGYPWWRRAGLIIAKVLMMRIYVWVLLLSYAMTRMQVTGQPMLDAGTMNKYYEVELVDSIPWCHTRGSAGGNVDFDPLCVNWIDETFESMMLQV